MSELIAKLGDICEIKRGTTITQKEAIEGVIPVVAGGINPTYFHNKANRVGNTISISGSGANAGYVNYWDIPIFASDCSTVQVFRDDLSLKFIHYFLLSKQEYIYKELRSGAAQPHVYGKDIANIEIHVPNLEKQNRIVERIERIFSEIDKANSVAKVNVKNAEALFQSYLRKVFEYDGKDWEVVKVSQLGRVQSGGTPSISKKEYWGDDVEWFSSGELNDLYTTSSIRRVTLDGINNSNAKIFPVNSLLIGMYDTAAMKMSLLSKPAAFNQAIVGIEPSDKVNMIFLYYALTYIKPYVLSLRRGVRQKNLSLAKIKDLSIQLPKLEVQNDVSQKLNFFKETSNKLSKGYLEKINQYTKIKNSILKRAFNGELVKE